MWNNYPSKPWRCVYTKTRMGWFSLCVPRGFGGRAGYEVSTAHVLPQCVPTVIILIGGGARDEGARGRARGKQRLLLYAMSYPTLWGQDRVPKPRGSDLSWVPLSATPALVHVCSKREQNWNKRGQSRPLGWAGAHFVVDLAYKSEFWSTTLRVSAMSIPILFRCSIGSKPALSPSMAHSSQQWQPSP